MKKIALLSLFGALLLNGPLYPMEQTQGTDSTLSLTTLEPIFLQCIVDRHNHPRFLVDKKNPLLSMDDLEWKDIISVQSTCRYLHKHFQDPRRFIELNYFRARPASETVESFLNRVFNKLEQIKLYPHTNRIVINLAFNRLSEDQDARCLEKFFHDIDAIGLSERIYELDLSNNGLSCLPDSIMKLRKLSSLNLANNVLSQEALKKVCAISTLEILILGANNLESLPDETSTMPCLRALNVASNRLPPEQIAELGSIQSLSKLVLYNNKIQSIPESLLHLDLTYLNLESTGLPEKEIAKLGCVKNLAFLNLTGNHLKHIPTQLCSLPLKFLCLSHNQLEDGELFKLCAIPTLEEIILNSCGLHAIPLEFGNLHNLSELHIMKNNVDQENVAMLISKLPQHCKVWADNASNR